MTGIYKITNLRTNKSYIGLSVHIEQRWKEHKAGKGNNQLYQDFLKYGIDNFKFEVLEECDISILSEREIYWISFYDTFNNGYNENPGGNTAIQAINATKKSIYCYDLNGKFIAEYESISEAERQTNIPNTNICKAAKGERAKAGDYQWSYEKLDKMGVYKRTCNFSNRTNFNQVKVCQYDKNFNLIKIFNSIKEASEETGANANCIGEICKTEGLGKRKTSGGYIWRYFKEEDING